MDKTSKKTLYKCSCCGDEFSEKKFSQTQSPYFSGCNHKITICTDCLNKMFDNFLKLYRSEEMAARRICMMYDIYYNDDIVNMARCRQNKNTSFMKFYVSKTFLIQYKAKTYDNTIIEEKKKNVVAKSYDNKLNDEQQELMDEVKRIYGVSIDDYEKAKILKFLYDDWMTKTGAATIVQESAVKNICWNQFCIIEAREKNQPTKEYESAMASQIKLGGWQTDAKNENLSEMCLGNWIKKYEMNKPIKEYPDKSYIKELIEVYFLGHLSKAVGVQNIYVNKYDEHMKKYTVERTEEDSKENEEIMKKVFGDG